MFNSQIYTNHFPVKSHHTNFTDKEKKALCRWAKSFRSEVLMRESAKSQQGFAPFPSYDIEKYNQKIMIQMIENNHFDDICLCWLNYIIYRHKYNAVLSIWLFPILTESQIEKYFKDIIHELEEV